MKGATASPGSIAIHVIVGLSGWGCLFFLLGKKYRSGNSNKKSRPKYRVRVFVGKYSDDSTCYKFIPEKRLFLSFYFPMVRGNKKVEFLCEENARDFILKLKRVDSELERNGEIIDII